MVGRLRAEGIDLTVGDVFERATVAGLAELVAGAGAEPAADLAAAPFAQLDAEDRARLPEGVVDAYPLSQVQTGVLVEMLADTGGNRYHGTVSYLVRDARPFAEDVLRRAVGAVVARQEVLRTSFHLSGYREPLQLVHAAVTVPLAVHDLRRLSAEEEADALRGFVAAERAAPFDIEAAPLLRVTAHLGAGGWRLSLTQSHALLDGWSLHSLMMELVDHYRALRSGREPVVPTAPPVRFADAVAAERRALGSAADRGYWRGVVAGHEPVALPPSWGDPTGERVDYAVPVEVADLEEDLRALAASVRVSPKSVLLAAYGKVLGALTEQDSFHSGLVCHVRPEVEGADRVCGMYLNTVPLPVARPTGSWRDLVREVFAREAELWPHRRFPLPEIQREAGVPGRLVDTLFSYLDFRALDDRDVDTRSEGGGGATEFALAVIGSLRGLAVKTNTGTLAREHGERVARMLRAVLEAMAADPDGDATATCLPPEELARLVADGAAELVGETAGRCPHELFAERAAATPDALAVVAGRHRLTYAEVDARANRLAHHLRGLGVGPESLVGVCLDRGVDLVSSLLGVLKAGAAYVPLDPVNPPERLAHVVADAGVAVTVTDAAHAGALTGELVVLDRLDLTALPATAPQPVVHPDNAMYVIHTSGSTGRPKGCVVTHAAVPRLVDRLRGLVAFGADDVWALTHSSAFDVSVCELWSALLTGATLVVVPRETAQDPDELLDLLVAERVTALMRTPSSFRPLVALAEAGDERVDRLALRLVIVGGEQLTAADVRPWVAHPTTGAAALLNVHGITEVAVIDTGHRVGPADAAGGPVPIGRPLRDVSLRLLDAAGDPVPAGVVGELHLGGPALARGYAGRPDLTARRFVPDPFGPPGSRLYRTGDLVRLRPDGAAEFVGRVDAQVKVRGHRVEPGEVEAVLGAHPAVRSAVVVVHGETGRLVAYHVPDRADEPADAADLAAHCARDLPEYMVPSAFVEVDEIPLTPNGKLDRRALPEPGAHDRREERADDRVAPRTDLERRVAEVWADVLGGSAAEVGVADDFFAAGGDSIRAVALVGALRAAGFDVSVRDVLRDRTVAGLAALLADRTGPAVEHGSVAPFALVPEADRERLPAGLSDAYPLTQVQVGMLVEALANGTGPAPYLNVATALVRDERPFDPDALRAALAVVASRHEALRTTVDPTGYSVPLQLIRSEVEIPFELSGRTGLTDDGWRDELAAFAAAERARGFDLGSAQPLLRVTAHVRDERSWFCTITQSHVIMEGWTFNLLLDELTDCYRRLRDGQAPPPHEPPAARFADAVAAELAALGSDEDRGFWRALTDSHAPFTLPTAWSGGPEVVEFGLVVPLAEHRDGLRALAAEAGVPLKAVLLAAHLKVLSRLTDEPAFHTGLVGHTRPEAAGAERDYGMYLSTLPFPHDRTAPTWSALVRQVQAREDERWRHRHFPMPEIQRMAGAGTRLLPVMFNYVDFRRQHADTVDVVATGAATEFDLAVHAHGDDRISLRTTTAALGRAEADRLAGMYRSVLAAMAADPAGDARAVHLDETEREGLPGGTAEAAPAVTRCLHEVFREQAAATPDAVAVVAGGTSLTYAQLNARANRLAHHLRGLGVGPESLVGVCLDRGVDLVSSLLGVLKAGAAYVPLDPVNPPERLRHLVADSGAAAVIASAEHGATVTGDVVVVDPGTAGADAPDTDPVPLAHPDNLAYAIYTSGSTGLPKGVAVTHANVVRLFEVTQEHYAFDESDVWVAAHSFAFDVSVFELFGALLHGGTLVVPASAAVRDPDAFLDLLVDSGATMLCQTPTAFRSLLAAADDPRLGRLALRAVVLAGERLEPAALVPWVDRLGLARTALVNMYGPTEASVYATYHRFTRRDLGAGGSPIGRPLADLRAHLLDAFGNPVPAGVPGELHLGGAGVARGYLDRPEPTAERFVPDPFGPPGSRLYRTGDVVRRSGDGGLDFLGRADQQVKVRGHRVEPGEVEAALAAHPQVREAVVLARPDRAGDQRLVAYLVLDGEPDVAGLRAFLARTLPAYLIPSAFVALAELPVTTSGKLDRRALPAPDDDAVARQGFVAPRTPLQERIAAVWARELGLDRVGAEDGFFDLGGDSIRAVAVVGALRAGGLAATVRDVLERRTVAELAEALDGRAAAVEAPPVEPFALLSPQDRAKLPAGLVDAYPLSRNQAGMLVEMLSGTGRGRYHVVHSVRVRDGVPFSADALRTALAELVARHDVLRTSVDLDGCSVPVQLVHATATVPVRVVDATGADDRDAVLRQFVAAEAGALFDHATAPLVRVTAHRWADGEWQCTFTHSHVVLDGWSSDLLLRHLLAGYRRAVDGLPPLPRTPPAIRFADVVAAEVRALASAEDRAFWHSVVDSHERFALPGGWGEPGPAEPFGVVVPLDDLADGLARLASAASASRKSVLLAAFTKVMSQLTPATAFHVGLTAHVRPEVGGADQVYGMHLNTLPFPVDRSARTWRELVRRVFDRELAMWPHRAYPMPAIQQERGEGRRLLEVYFSYQDFDQSDVDDVVAGGGAGAATNEFPFSVAPGPGGLVLRTNTGVLGRDAARRVAEVFRAVLEAMADDPDGDATRTWLPAGEPDRLREWSTGPVVEPCGWTAPERFEEQVRATPGATALVSGEVEVTYADLDAAANRVARRLRALGVGPESVVGVLLDRGPDLVAALLGVWKAGAAYLPVDPGSPAARVVDVLADAGAGAVVTGAALADRVAGFPGHAVDLDRDAALLADLPAHRPDVPADPDRLAYVICTSGSTGRPKGVLVHHRGLANHLRWAVDELTARGTGGAPLFSSVAFDLVVPNLWAPLLTGQPVHLLPPELDRLGEHLAAAAPYAFVKLTPGHLRVLVHQLSAEQAAGLTGVLVVAGEAFTGDVLAAWRALAPDVPVINEYGPTEASVGSTIFPVDGEPAAEVLPIGRPLPGTTAHVLGQALQPVPVGVPGELHVGGAGVARGYAGRPGATAERFLPDPFGGPGDRLYRTGDLARWLPGGEIEFLGRLDRQVKVRGYRIEPAEVEVALTAHADVADARVLARGAGADQRLVAYLVPAAEEVDLAGVREALGRRLPEHLVPADFVALAELPLNANGKLDESALPEPGPRRADASRVPPRTPTELALAEIWAEVLEVPGIGVGDSFFDLGGHSILVIRAVAAARGRGLPLTLVLFYQHGTLAALAAALDAVMSSAAKSGAGGNGAAAGGAAGSGAAANEAASGGAVANGVPPALPSSAPGLTALTAITDPPNDATIPSPLAAMAAHRVPGLSAARLAGGELVAVEAFGELTPGGPPVTPDALFQVGSLSKHVTAFGVLRLVGQGALDLDADVNHYLRGWRVPEEPGVAPVTARLLLGHRSGLAPNPGKGYPADRVPALADLLHGRAGHPAVTRETAPDTAFRKANVHYSVLQLLLEDLTGSSFADLMRDLVLDPLGMHASDFDQDFPHRCGSQVALGHHADGSTVDGGWLVRPDLAAAGLWTTATDLAKFAAEVRRSALGRPLAVFARPLVEQALTPHPDSLYGLGTVVDPADGDPQFGHGGEPVGYHAFSTCRVRSGEGWVVLTNGAAGAEVIRGLIAEPAPTTES
ncbi:non-ribosomal peptide synthetase [Saccharothrix xinjiangensis]